MIEVFRAKRVFEPETIDVKDMISLEEAAQISKRAVSVISGMLDRGTLPWYQLHSPESPTSIRIQRFTSRSAVQAIVKSSKK